MYAFVNNKQNIKQVEYYYNCPVVIIGLSIMANIIF